MLFMNLEAHKKQALFPITVHNIVTEENKIVFLPNETLKHISTDWPLESLIYQGCTLNKKLCIVNTVQCYLGMQKKLVNANIEQFIFTIVIRNEKVIWKHEPYCWYFYLNFKFLEWPYRKYIKTAKMAAWSEDVLYGDDFNAVLAIFCFYHYDASASEAVVRIAIDKIGKIVYLEHI